MGDKVTTTATTSQVESATATENVVYREDQEALTGRTTYVVVPHPPTPRDS